MHPNYDEFWQRQTALPYLDRVNVPTLSVAGWWDQEDFYGPITIFEALEKHDTEHMNFLVVGPWYHGGWGFEAEGNKLGAIDFGSPTAAYFRSEVMAPFFAYYLKDRGTGEVPEGQDLRGGYEQMAGVRQLAAEDRCRERASLFHIGWWCVIRQADARGGRQWLRQLCVGSPHPVPYRHRPIPRGIRLAHLAGRGPALRERPTRRVVVRDGTAGRRRNACRSRSPRISFAATTGSDADWVVKLIDVYPDTMPSAQAAMGGYELMVANDVFRGRFRESYTTPHPITPNHVEEYKVDLHTQDYKFLKGHRIMVQVQSSWFPIIDRNPQQYVPNIFAATDADYRVARERVYRNGAQAFVSRPASRNRHDHAVDAATRPVPARRNGVTWSFTSRAPHGRNGCCPRRVRGRIATPFGSRRHKQRVARDAHRGEPGWFGAPWWSTTCWTAARIHQARHHDRDARPCASARRDLHANRCVGAAAHHAAAHPVRH